MGNKYLNTDSLLAFIRMLLLDAKTGDPKHQLANFKEVAIHFGDLDERLTAGERLPVEWASRQS